MAIEPDSLGHSFEPLRKNSGLTMRRSSAHPALSASLVSRVGRIQTDPMIDSLRRIAEAPHVCCIYFLSQHLQPKSRPDWKGSLHITPVVRAPQSPPCVHPDYRLTDEFPLPV